MALFKWNYATFADKFLLLLFSVYNLIFFVYFSFSLYFLSVLNSSVHFYKHIVNISY